MQVKLQLDIKYHRQIRYLKCGIWESRPVATERRMTRKDENRTDNDSHTTHLRRLVFGTACTVWQCHMAVDLLLIGTEIGQYVVWYSVDRHGDQTGMWEYVSFTPCSLVTIKLWWTSKAAIGRHKPQINSQSSDVDYRRHSVLLFTLA